MERMNGLLNVYLYNPIGWDVLMACIAIVIFGQILPTRFEVHRDGWSSFIPRGRGKMLKRARWNFVVSQAINDFVNAVEERVFNGEYSRDEAKHLYREAKKAFPVRDLFPHPELLKEAIRNRLANNIHLPVPLPPLEVPPKKKHMFDK